MDDIGFLVRRIVRSVRTKTRRVERDPEAIWGIIAKHLDSSDPATESPTVQRTREALRRELIKRRQRRGQPFHGLAPLLAPTLLTLRSRLSRWRCQSAATLGPSQIVEALGSWVAVALLAGIVAVIPPVNTDGTINLASLSRSTVQAAGQLASSRPSPTATPLGAQTGRLSSDAPIRSVTLRSNVPAAAVDAHGRIKRPDRRIVIEDELAGRLHASDFDIASGELLWIDCDPKSTVWRSTCDTYDAVPSNAGG